MQKSPRPESDGRSVRAAASFGPHHGERAAVRRYQWAPIGALTVCARTGTLAYRRTQIGHGAYLILSVYEWCHFLIHTPYRPQGRYYRAIWRGHRLHHFKNEHYWFGVTSTVADHLLGTAPNQAEVARSGTARTLGVDGLGDALSPPT